MKLLLEVGGAGPVEFPAKMTGLDVFGTPFIRYDQRRVKHRTINSGVYFEHLLNYFIKFSFSS